MKRSIRHWPAGERPRERLLLEGEEKLSDAELLAIFLRTGVAGQSAVDLARALLLKFGGIRGLFRAKREDLNRIKGLGAAKIAQLKAVKELNRRHLKEEAEKGSWAKSPDKTLAFLYQTLRDLEEENFLVVFLNAQNEIIKIENVFKGSLTKSEIYPRQIVNLALKHNASALIFVHNHPSGRPHPSIADKKLTKKMKGICEDLEIRILDHIIVGENGHYSFMDAGLI